MRAAAGAVVGHDAATRAAATSATVSQGCGASTLLTCGANIGDADHDLGGGAVGHDLAVGEDDDAGRDLGGQLDVVGGEHHAVAVGGEVAQRGDQALLGGVVEAARGLVEQQHRGRGGEHHGEREREALPLGEVARVGGVVDAGSEPVEHRARRARARRRSRASAARHSSPTRSATSRSVGSCGTSPTRVTSSRPRRRRGTRAADASRCRVVRVVQADERGEQRRLAGAVAAHDRDDLAAVGGQGDAAQRRHRAVADDDVARR